MIVSMCIFLKIAKISDLIIVKLSHVECSGITLNTAKMSFLLHLLLLKKKKSSLILERDKQVLILDRRANGQD